MKNNMNFLILIISGLFFCLSVSADCEFESTVFPNKEYKRMEQLYTTTCLWFSRVYTNEFDPDIILEKIFFIESWDEVKESKDLDRENLLGLFTSGIEKKTNKIWINTSVSDNHLINNNKDYIDSLIVHELVHFFTKRANFELLSKNIIDKHFTEAIAYYAQNEYLIAHTGEDLFKYIKKTTEEEFVVSDLQIKNFPCQVHIFTFFGLDFVVHHSIAWMSENPAKKYKNIMSNTHNRHPVQCLRDP